MYRNTSSQDLEQDFEILENTIKEKILLHVRPKIALFFIQKLRGTNPVQKCAKIKTPINSILMPSQQAKKLGVETYKSISCFSQKCCLLISANSSYIKSDRNLHRIKKVRYHIAEVSKQ